MWIDAFLGSLIGKKKQREKTLSDMSQIPLTEGGDNEMPLCNLLTIQQHLVASFSSQSRGKI